MKYMLHPGEIISENDGEKHFIHAAKLIQLYDLRRGEYIVFNALQAESIDWNAFCHLYPQTHFERYTELSARIADYRKHGCFPENPK